ncbi:MAG: flagellar assembly protein FliW [Candidatus Omnitrophota bacterium]
MEIVSKLFGKIEYTAENVIHFEEGLIGISEKKNFILIEKEDFKPFGYLQSVDDGAFILIVINPLLVVDDYEFSIFMDDMDAVGVNENDPDGFSLLAIVIFSKQVENITVNLKAPILINIHTKKAKQVILQNDDYSVEEPLIRPVGTGTSLFK